MRPSPTGTLAGVLMLAVACGGDPAPAALSAAVADELATAAERAAAFVDEGRERDACSAVAELVERAVAAHDAGDVPTAVLTELTRVADDLGSQLDCQARATAPPSEPASPSPEGGDEDDDEDRRDRGRQDDDDDERGRGRGRGDDDDDD